MKNTSTLSKRESNKIQTRNTLVNAGVALFLAQGYDNTTLEQVAERAGVHVQTLYRYFDNKESLALYFMAQTHKGLLDAVKTRKDSRDIRSTIGFNIVTFLHTLDDNSLLMNLYQMTESVPSLKAYNVLHYKLTEEALAKLLSDEKNIEAETDTESKALAALLISALWDALSQWGYSETKISAAEAFKHSLAFIDSKFS